MRKGWLARQPEQRRLCHPQTMGTLNLVASGFEGQAHIVCLCWKPEGTVITRAPSRPGKAHPCHVLFLFPGGPDFKGGHAGLPLPQPN